MLVVMVVVVLTSSPHGARVTRQPRQPLGA
jgi:hypothetical protein